MSGLSEKAGTEVRTVQDMINHAAHINASHRFSKPPTSVSAALALTAIENTTPLTLAALLASSAQPAFRSSAAKFPVHRGRFP
jgi:hypothetical protein